ncbi:hypothetical protein A234_28696, partial [Pseudomonas syringae pv. actinidiae ICMP 19101]
SLRALNCTASLVAMKAGRTDAQHPALHNDRPETAMSKNERVLQLDAFAKYAVAFSRMSRSILTRANSARIASGQRQQASGLYQPVARPQA